MENTDKSMEYNFFVTWELRECNKNSIWLRLSTLKIIRYDGIIKVSTEMWQRNINDMNCALCSERHYSSFTL